MGSEHIFEAAGGHCFFEDHISPCGSYDYLCICFFDDVIKDCDFIRVDWVRAGLEVKIMDIEYAIDIKEDDIEVRGFLVHGENFLRWTKYLYLRIALVVILVLDLLDKFLRVELILLLVFLFFTGVDGMWK